MTAKKIHSKDDHRGKILIISAEGATIRQSASEHGILPGPREGSQADRLLLIDNGKEGGHEVLESVASIFTNCSHVEGVDWIYKGSRSGFDKASDFELTAGDFTSSNIDLPRMSGGLIAISGVGDCGGCTTRSCRYAKGAQELGAMPIVVSTEPFRPLAERLLASTGVPLGALVTIPHPILGAPESQVRESAKIIAAAIERKYSLSASRLTGNSLV